MKKNLKKFLLPVLAFAFILNTLSIPVDAEASILVKNTSNSWINVCAKSRHKKNEEKTKPDGCDDNFKLVGKLTPMNDGSISLNFDDYKAFYLKNELSVGIKKSDIYKINNKNNGHNDEVCNIYLNPFSSLPNRPKGFWCGWDDFKDKKKKIKHDSREKVVIYIDKSKE